MNGTTELEQLKQKALKVLKKAEETGKKLNDLDLGAISRIGKVEDIEHLHYLVLRYFDDLCDRMKVR